MFPPGIPPCDSYATTGVGVAEHYDEWRPFSATKRYTNAFVYDPNIQKVLLGYKKRGFGYGMYNGFGGKVDPGESVLDAAIRELKEEANISAPLEPCGLLLFVGAGHAHAHHITVFSATSWEGDPSESEEMRPQWFAYPPLKPSTTAPETDPHGTDLPPFPYSLMWKDDPLWIPHLLSNTPFVARVDYGPVPVPLPPSVPTLLEKGTGYILDGQEVESGMQRWWVATVDKDEWRQKKIWEV